MDRRHLKILSVACLGLAAGRISTGWSQEAGGPGFRRPPGPMAHFGPAQEGLRRAEQVPAEERETFNRNLKMWRDLPPEERVALREEARARMHAEIDKAVQDSGLHLDADQREMFSLRYTQERRKLERDLQRQTAVERSHRMPEILARLKSEFGGGATSPAVKSEGSPAEAKPGVSASPVTSAAPSAH